jgi:hypothetical protein
MFFSGFRGVNASNATALDLATRTPIEKLQELVATGFSQEDIDAAVFSAEMGRQQDFATERNIGVKLLRWAGCTYSPRRGAKFIGAGHKANLCYLLIINGVLYPRESAAGLGLGFC